jgi:hypothetical protein
MQATWGFLLCRRNCTIYRAINTVILTGIKTIMLWTI